MQAFGIFLAVVALVALIFGVMQRMKMKKILAAPFKRTGEIAANPGVADAKGMISTEGAVQVQQPVMAPCSGKPCLYYEVKVTRRWEKSVQTENGMKTEKGTDTVTTQKQGGHFWVNDGSGAVGVDASSDVDVDLDKSFEQAQNVSWGDVVFGNFRTNVPHAGGDKRTVSVEATEKILPAEGNLFVMGKLANGTITKTDGMLGKLLASRKGREKLVGATKRNSLIGLIAGAVMMFPGLGMAIFAPPGEKGPCDAMADAPGIDCPGKIYNDSGTDRDWTVTKEATYEVRVKQPPVKNPIFPVVTVTGPDGKKYGGSGDRVSETFAPGAYKINVRDSQKGYVEKIQGGFSYNLAITGGAGSPDDDAAPADTADSATAVASASASASAKPTTKAPVKPTVKPTPKKK